MTVLTEGPDVSNSVSTSTQIAAGDYFFGTLETSGDSDWVEVSLVQGQNYTFGLTGVGALSDNLSDSFLRLRDSSGIEIASDDDGGPGRSSAITFTATASGTYYVDVQSWNNSRDGDYGLSMAIGNRASYDVTMGAGNLIRNNASWASAPETNVTVTWGIRASGTEPGGGNPFIAPSVAQVSAIESSMAYISGVSGLTFDQVNSGGTSNNASILFGAYSANDGSGAYAYFPGNTASTSNAGDVWLNNNAGSTTSLQVGSYSYFTILHEIGHALGLAHPGDYNASPGVSITYAANAQFTEDSHQYTVMSYFDESNTATSVRGYPDTLMLYDLYALHQQYGADHSYHSGNTVYGFNATAGGAYNFNMNTNPLLSIWDGGGTDTIDLSGYSQSQTLNLNAGTFSNVGGYSGNLSIAIGASIESGTGGSSNDVIVGNGANNTLLGGSGNDTLNGDTGNDWLEGGLGNDSLQGNQGNDTLYGLSGNDSIGGGQNNDHVEGGAGNDTLKGGKGDDTLNGGADGDLIIAALGNDSLQGNQGNDRLFGGEGNDFVGGGKDNDFVEGGAGNDTLKGGKGDDTLNGGNGVDTFHFYQGWNNDLIEDFEDDIDVIILTQFNLTSASNALSFATQQSNDVVFDFGSGDTLTILNSLKENLADDLTWA